ncbi:MAG: alpha-ketoglutarate-dependent dioxygenase AlkB [Pseudoxanthomonas suwonensis]|nr:alpha-ketoglutarate-dependent dioxygenase AlkB [Pseudoxanthomonas suwonensis]
MSDEPAGAGIEVRHVPGWLPRANADALLTALREQLPWSVHRVRLFGREVDVPRLSCWIGEPDAVYRYSGATFRPVPWPTWLLPLRRQVEDACGTRFNSALANRYRDGRDAMGWHSDDEPELGTDPVIASLSLGGSRRFLLRSRATPVQRQAHVLGHGDLLVMAGATQRLARHALPRTARPVQERINLTFRLVLPGRGAGSNG